MHFATGRSIGKAPVRSRVVREAGDELPEPVRSGDPSDARPQPQRGVYEPVLAAEVGRRFHGREQLALYLERFSRPAGVGRSDGRSGRFRADAGFGIQRSAAVRRQLLRRNYPRDPGDAGDEYGKLRSRQSAGAAHDLPVRLCRPAVEGAVLAPRGDEPFVQQPGGRLLRRRG